VPYFTRQVAQNGNLIVDAVIGVSLGRRGALTAASQPIPRSVHVQGLIDTGASCSCVDPSVLRQLQLTPTGSSPVNTPTTGHQVAYADQYDISLMTGSPNEAPLIRGTLAVLEAILLAPQGFHAIIGRDVLDACLLVYDGKLGLFSIAY
jgi:hypothetical protein